MPDAIHGLTLDLIRTGGPITTVELLNEIRLLTRLGSVSGEDVAASVAESLDSHRRDGRARETAEGWEYVPRAPEPTRMEPPRRRRSKPIFNPQRSLFGVESVRGRV